MFIDSFFIFSSCSGQDSIESCGSCSTSSEGQGKLEYRVLVLGASMVGKTGILSQFLYDSFIGPYKETVDEMYHGEFDVGSCDLSLNIQDTGGNYVHDFPAMVDISLQSADAFILVYAVDDPSSWDEVVRLRNLVIEHKGEQAPIVVVGNKTDLERKTSQEALEATVMFDWEHGYVECSAKDNINTTAVFKELLGQARNRFEISCQTPAASGSTITRGSLPSTPLVIRRRTSLPQVPAFTRLMSEESTMSGGGDRAKVEKRSSSFALNKRRDSCKVQ